MLKLGSRMVGSRLPIRAWSVRRRATLPLWEFPELVCACVILAFLRIRNQLPGGFRALKGSVSFVGSCSFAPFRGRIGLSNSQP